MAASACTSPQPLVDRQFRAVVGADTTQWLRGYRPGATTGQAAHWEGQPPVQNDSLGLVFEAPLLVQEPATPALADSLPQLAGLQRTASQKVRVEYYRAADDTGRLAAACANVFLTEDQDAYTLLQRLEQHYRTRFGRPAQGALPNLYWDDSATGQRLYLRLHQAPTGFTVGVVPLTKP